MHFIGMYIINVHLTGVHLMGVYLINVHLTSMHLTGVYLISVHIMGVHLMGVYPMGVHLTTSRSSTLQMVVDLSRSEFAKKNEFLRYLVVGWSLLRAVQKWLPDASSHRLPQPGATIGFQVKTQSGTVRLGLHHHDFNLRELALTKTPTMGPPRAARSTNRRNTPLSPPKNAGAVASTEQTAGRRSTRSQSRHISNEHSNLASRKLNESKGLRVPETGKDLCTFAFVRETINRAFQAILSNL